MSDNSKRGENKEREISTPIPASLSEQSGDAGERLTHRGIVELGCAGHFIAADSCRWKRHTQVGNYRVSSIGDYHPGRGDRDTIGAGPDAFYETLVFETTDQPNVDNEGCGCHAVKEWSEIDGERYPTAGEAQAGHERYVAKYAERLDESAIRPSSAVSSD